MAVNAEESECGPLALTWDMTPAQPILQLFHANRSLQEAQIEMIIRRGEGIVLDVKMASEQLELSLKKQHLKRAFIRANKVIKENRAGTLPTTEKITENVKDILILADQINRVRRDITKQHQVKEELDIYVQKYSDKYEKFLQRVATSSSEFNSVRDILDRFENLDRCRRECEQMVEEEMNAAGKMRQEMYQLSMEQSSHLKKLNNSFEMITVRHKEAKDKRVKWEHAVKRIQDHWGHIHCESEVMRSGCYNLYSKICQRRGVPPTAGHSDTKAQLHYIQTSIPFFKETLRLATNLNQERENNKLIKMSPSFVKSFLEEKKKQAHQMD